MSDEEMKQNAMNILAYRQIGLIEATDTLYNTIQEMLNYIDKLEKSNKEWFDIADNILRATNKYGEISIGEVANYIDKLQKELEQERKLTTLIIDDFQAENYFINMTNKEVRKYYSERKELK